MKVFISHIHEEAKIAFVLKEWIESTFLGQVEVFVSSDTKDIPAGSRWLSEIDTALSSSILFLIFCSPTSISRPWINFEAGCAWIKKVPLIPICHPLLSKSELPATLSMFQAIQIDSDDFVDTFFESLKIQLKINKLPRIDKNAMEKELESVLMSIDFPSLVNPLKEEISTSLSETDALNILESWMGHRPASENTKIIKYSEIDNELKLPKGYTKKLIEIAAQRWKYIVVRKGEDTILLKEEAVHRKPTYF